MCACVCVSALYVFWYEDRLMFMNKYRGRERQKKRYCLILRNFLRNLWGVDRSKSSWTNQQASDSVSSMLKHNLKPENLGTISGQQLGGGIFCSLSTLRLSKLSTN